LPMQKQHFIILLLTLSLGLCMMSCRTGGGATAAMKRIEDTKAEKAKEVQKQYDAALKRHQDIQTKQTRKQMKALKKRSDELNKRSRGR